MKPVAIQTLRSRWFAGLVHAGLWLLLGLAVVGQTGKRTPFHELDTGRVARHDLLPATALEHLFPTGNWPAPCPDPNAPSPFATREAPTPPPPTTKQIELTYQGFFQTADGPRETVVRLADSFLVTPVGARLTANLFAAAATMQTLTLTNPAAETYLLSLNVKKEIEVPAK